MIYMSQFLQELKNFFTVSYFNDPFSEDCRSKLKVLKTVPKNFRMYKSPPKLL